MGIHIYKYYIYIYIFLFFIYIKEGEKPPQITSWPQTRLTTIMMIFSDILVIPPLSWLCLCLRK